MKNSVKGHLNSAQFDTAKTRLGKNPKTISRGIVMLTMRIMSVTLLMTAAAAQAATPNTFDAGVGLGYANYTVSKGSFSKLTPSASIDATSYNLRLFGSYYFDELLGLSLDMVSGGAVNSTDNGVTTKLFDSNMLTISAVFAIPVNDRVEMHAKIGGTSWQFTSQGSAPINDGFGPSFGLGADINLYGGNERKLRVEWNHYQLDNVYVKSANDISINMVFTFSGKK